MNDPLLPLPVEGADALFVSGTGIRWQRELQTMLRPFDFGMNLSEIARLANTIFREIAGDSFATDFLIGI